MHLTSETVGIRAVVVGVAVEVRVTVDDIVVSTVGTIVATYARVRVREIMTEAKLQSRIVVVAEGTALYLVMRALKLYTIVTSLSDVQTVDMPVIALELYAAVGR